MVESVNVDAGVAKKAKKMFKEGKNAMKTGLFKWYADYIEASSKFEQAGKLFKANGDNE